MTSTASYGEVCTSLIARGGKTTLQRNYLCQFLTLCAPNGPPVIVLIGHCCDTSGHLRRWEVVPATCHRTTQSHRSLRTGDVRRRSVSRRRSLGWRTPAVGTRPPPPTRPRSPLTRRRARARSPRTRHRSSAPRTRLGRAPPRRQGRSPPR